VWSAACSTGEEPYSVAMVLLDRFPPASGWTIDILASDLSTKVLRQAESGLWPVEKADDIPEHYRKAFMLRGTGDRAAWMKAGPRVRPVVTFERLNLNEERLYPSGPFDLILCRNVLIYFEKASRMEILPRLAARLSPGGYLFLGHAESLAGLGGIARAAGPSVYRAPRPETRDASTRS
jgi:chemotaxis protein methyltransferase CheR